MSLYISASGILNAVERQQVRANNVANLRTPGFRAGRPVSSETPGGGARLSGVQQNNARGPVELTGRPLDLAQSDGFFQVEQQDGSLAYTRAGQFGLNADGEIVTSSGARLSPPVQVPGDATSVAVTSSGEVIATTPGDAPPQVVGQIEVFTFPNPGGLEAQGDGLYSATPASGAATPAGANATLEPNAVQGSNVDLLSEQTGTILDVNAAQANIVAFRVQSEVLGVLLDIEG